MVREEIPILINRISNRSKMLENRKLKRFDLTSAQWECLAYIMGSKTITSQKVIETRFEITHPAANGIVSRLESKGLIRSSVDEQDRRQKLLFPTDKGCRIYEELSEERVYAARDMFSGLTTDEINTLDRLLRRVYKNLL